MMATSPAELVDRARRMRHEVLPAYRHRLTPHDYIVLTCDADVAITAAEAGNKATVDRILARLDQRLHKLDVQAGVA